MSFCQWGPTTNGFVTDVGRKTLKFVSKSLKQSLNAEKQNMPKPLSKTEEQIIKPTRVPLLPPKKTASTSTESKSPRSYFVSEKPNIKFIGSGCALLDCALGGGYALGRVVNIVGDKSTSKTALATEAIINFMRQYPKGKAAYRDAEAAFDRAYAAEMGLDDNKVDFGTEDLTTVEGFARDLEQFLDKASGQPCIYVLDSLDALSDEDEMENDIGKATFGVRKAKTLSTLFRKLAGKIEQKECLLLIVSQVRDNIGAMFGEKHKRSGGRALDFYSSQCLWLAHLKTHKKTISKVERPYGIRVKGKLKKNKVGLPFREAEFDFIFGYGVDDVGASVEWLSNIGRLETAGIRDAKNYLKEMEKISDEEYDKNRIDLTKAVKEAWAEVEITFLPRRSKYRKTR